MSISCWFHIYFTLISRLFHVDFTLISHWFHFYFTLISLLFHIDITSISHWFHVYFTLILRLFHIDSTSISRLFRADFTSISRWFHSKVTNAVCWEQTLHILYSRKTGFEFPHTYALMPGYRGTGQWLQLTNAKAVSKFHAVDTSDAEE